MMVELGLSFLANLLASLIWKAFEALFAWLSAYGQAHQRTVRQRTV